MKSLTIDQRSLDSRAAGQLDLSNFISREELPQSTSLASCTEVGDHGYILSYNHKPSDGLLTIKLGEDGPLSDLEGSSKEEAFARILRCALMIFTGRTSLIPIAWRPFHFKNRITFQTGKKHNQPHSARIVADVVQKDGPRVYAFHQDKTGSQDISNFNPDISLLNEALEGIEEAERKRSEFKSKSHTEKLGSNIFLEEDYLAKTGRYSSFDDWYNAKLTVSQRKFVDHPFSSSVRLVGPAGSGKTVTLAVKCLKELRRSAEENLNKRILFLTHASLTAKDIENLVLSMDQETALNALTCNPPALVITTLYALANSHMRYDLDNLTPVSLDGHEGRLLQSEILDSIISDEISSDWITFRSSCSEPFATYIESAKDSPERRFFLWELLNEFACVLDAEGVRRGIDRREKYLTEKRKAWMMPIHSREEREVVLRLYDKFGAWLRESKAIGADQMIADFINYLDSYRWEATRQKEGFSAVFVDELHLFNRQERMLFSYLLSDPSAQPAVFMAYDAKQSPRDTFLGLADSETQKYDLWKDARLGKTEKIELIDVFRYTPQIAKVLSMIDQSFPGQDLDSDWPNYSGISQTEDGPIPIFAELPSTPATYGIIFKRAKMLQDKLPKNARVAVLCCSQELFQKYLGFPDLRDNYLPVTSREEAVIHPQSRKKFIFSMPEYVAGLQYHTVILIDVNRGEVPEGPYSLSSLRKFVSSVYLGASRAEQVLEFYANTEHGGVAPLLSLALLEGAIEAKDIEAIRAK
jgi:hypothetical protein